TVINRNLDWINNPHLINNALIIIWVTGDPSKQSFVTFGFIGLIGALSGMNEYGVATFQNMGNYMAPPTGTGFYPVNLAQRDGLEAADYNGDGLCTARDVTDAVRAHNVSSTFIVHSAGPAFDESSAEVLEIHNAYGFAIRTVADNPEYFGDNLVATNHFRLLKPPAYCYRYSRISDSLETSNQLDVNRNWNVLTAAGVTTNLQTIQFIPAQNIIRFSMAEPGTPAFLIPPTQVDMDSLFSMFNVGINEQNLTNETSVSIYPNPGKDQINIVIEAGENRSVSISISDLNGRKVLQVNEMTLSQNIFTYNWNSSRVPDGVYFANIDLHSRTTGKTMKVTKKVVIAR
ncbi:MAG: T9SS type A sorting domain-containing protein, partial [Bacteroidales bacterium]|nr:T9SS type A sorting domain-containing protein [Bacteroidales bacterium]